MRYLTSRSATLLALAPLLGVGALVAAAAAPAAAQQTIYISREPTAWLGMTYDVQWLQSDAGCEPRVLVEHVVQGSPAERAGLRPGDVVLALDGRPIPGGSLKSVAARLEPGDSLRLRVHRGGRVHDLTAVAAPRPDRPPAVLFAPPAEALRSSSAPIARVEGERLVVHNVDRATGPTYGYWFATGERREYRSLGGRAKTEIDRRVSDLLQCAGEVQGTSMGLTELEQVQRRADSLRVLIARRAMERERAPGVSRGVPPTPPGPAQIRPAPAPPSVELRPLNGYALRLEDHVVAGLRGVAGAEVTPLEAELAEYFRNAREGLLVLRIAPDTPAARAGLRPGDVIVQAGGHRLRSVAELRALLASPGPGPIRLTIVRKGSTQQLTLRS